MSRRGQLPAYSLEMIQTLVEQNKYRITHSASLGAGELYLDEDDIKECVLSLRRKDYDKTLRSHQRPGEFQDVYLPRFHGYEIYLKLQLLGNSVAVVISFKQNESP